MIKKILLIIFTFIGVQNLYSLSPIDYREFATNSSNVLLTNTTLYEVNIRILNGTTPIYEEYFGYNTITTDDFGLFRVNIGTGNYVSGSYSFTPTNNHWIVCRIKPSSGDVYRLISQVKLLNTVYKNAIGVGNTVESSEITNGTIVDVDISPTAGIQVSKLAPGSNGQVLTVSGGVPTWANVSYTETDPVWTAAQSSSAITISGNWTITGDFVNTVNPWADNEVANNLTINSGTITNTTIDNSVIGGTTAAAGTFTTLTATTLNATTSNLGTVASGTWNGSLITDTYVDNTLTITAGSIDGTPIGVSTPAAGTFTNLTVNSTSTFNNTVNVSGTNDVNIGNGTFDNTSADADLYVTGNLEVDGNVYLGNAATDNLTVNAVSTFNQRISVTGTSSTSNNLVTINDNGTAVALEVIHNNVSGSTASFTESNASNSSPVVQISHAGSGDGLYIDASIGTGSGLVVNGNNTKPTAIFNTQTASGLNGFEIINTGSVSYAFYVNGDYAGAAAFDANTTGPSVTITNFGSGQGLYIDASIGTGSGLVVDGNNNASTAIFNTNSSVSFNGIEITNSSGTAGYSLHVNASSGARAAAFDANTSSTGTSVAISNLGSGYGLYIDNTPGLGGSALRAETSSLSNSAVTINNAGGGLALSIDDNGGAVKLSYASDITVNPTVPDGVSVFYATANSTSITLPIQLILLFLMVYQYFMRLQIQLP